MSITIENPVHAMLLARGYAISSYSELEQSLCMLFGGLADVRQDVAALIFFRIINTRSRLAILEGLFKKRFDSDFNLFRNSIVRHVKDLDIARNNIIHWTTVSRYNERSNVTLGETPPDEVTLIPPNFWWKREENNNITIGEVFDFCDKCSAVSRAINIFSAHFVQHFAEITDDERAPWRERFSQPLPYPLPEDHPLYAPPSMRKNQPPPSQK